MKKILALALAAAMSLSLAACGSKDPGSTSNKGPGSAQNPGSSSAAPAGGSDFKVGAVYINSQNDTAGYTFQHHNGIVTAMKELGLDPETQLLIVDNVPDTDDTAVANAIDTLAGQGEHHLRHLLRLHRFHGREGRTVPRHHLLPWHWLSGQRDQLQ